MDRPPTQSKNLTIALVAIAGSCLVLTASCGFFVYQGIQQGVRSAGPLIACTGDLEAVRGALLDYADANKGKLPSSTTWKDDLRPFFAKRQEDTRQSISAIPGFGKDLTEKLSPINGEWGCQVNAEVFHAFMYNAELSEKNMKDFPKPETVVAFFEGKGGKNGSAVYKPTAEKTGPVFGGEMREFMRIGLKGEIRDQVNVGSGSPASSPLP